MNSRSRRVAKPSLETLELRCTPATVMTVGHSLWITGTDGADTVSVSNQTINQVNYIQVTEQVGAGAIKSSLFKMSALTGGNVFFFGHKGDDHFTNTSTLRLIAYGGPGNDYYYSRTASFIYAGAGNNTIDCSAATGVCVLDGGAGNDTIYGGTGTNFIDGGAGNDVLVGNPHAGINYINGGAGDDRIYGGGGTNYLRGGAGDDTIYGGGGTNYLYGDAGNDTLIASPSSTLNYLDGGAGNDVLYAGGGTNYLYGGAGNDTLIGGSGTNYLYGGAGTDTLYGGSGSNVLDGGRDGSTDHLIGGTGRNKFRQDFYFTGVAYIDRTIITNYDPMRDTLYS